MFRHILDQPPLDETDGPITIIMTPTRELCMQIGKDIKKFSKSLGLHAVCVYGGTGISEQIAELKRGMLGYATFVFILKLLCKFLFLICVVSYIFRFNINQIIL